MRRWAAKGVLLWVGIGLFLTGPALAQNREAAWELLPYIGYFDYSDPKLGDRVIVTPDDPMTPTEYEILEFVSEIDSSVGFGFRFGYHWTKKQAVEFGVASGGTDALITRTLTTTDDMGVVKTDPGTGEPLIEIKHQELDVDTLVGHANYVFNFFLHRRDKIVAFVTGGIGVVSTSTFALADDPDFGSLLDDLVGDHNGFMYNYGGGIRFFGGERVGFRVEARRYEYDLGERDGLNHLEVSAGLSIVVGGTY